MVARRRNGKQTPEYTAWINMRARCYKRYSDSYEYYGGRGIKVCDRWLNSFENFAEDMGLRPPGHSLERMDNSKDYSPDNVCWATHETQMNNTRFNKIVEWDGREQTVSRWARELGIDPSNLSHRLLKWPKEKAMTRAGDERGLKLTKEDAEAIRVFYDIEDVSQAELGERFGVSQTMVGKIVRNEYWIGSRRDYSKSRLKVLAEERRNA